MIRPTHLLKPMLFLLIMLANLNAAAGPGADNKPAIPDEQPLNLDQVVKLLREQQQEMQQQRQLLEAQSSEIATLKQELKSMRGIDLASAPAPARHATMETEVVSAKEQTEKQRATETGEAVTSAQVDDPTRDMLKDITGAWRIPGSNATLGIGGYVKTSVVYNYDPLEIQDRFIVGSIPVDSASVENAEAQSSITASQSRLNFDLHQATHVGIMRAFIEGDFAEENDTFRLRHAFGQWRRVLAGKTWSAFVDTEASPEEIDFEGLNARVNVRQAQVRIMPRYGTDYEFQLSLEDPNPSVQNGQGVTRVPDLVATGRFQPHERLHLKVALLGRQIRAQQEPAQGAGIEKSYGWGLSLSGRFNTPMLDQRDSLLLQLNGGTGIGRYINDLASVGDYDGIINPGDGDLELFDVLAGYVSWQHWWRDNLRSNVTLGLVQIDNPGFLDGGAYYKTSRFSSNVIWTPTPSINIGLEYLWGQRENEDGEDGNATQIQAAVKYMF